MGRSGCECKRGHRWSAARLFPKQLFHLLFSCRINMQELRNREKMRFSQGWSAVRLSDTMQHNCKTKQCSLRMSCTERTPTTLSVSTTSCLTFSSACVLPGRQHLCPTCSTACSICRGNTSGSVWSAQTERVASASEVRSAALHVVTA